LEAWEEGAVPQAECHERPLFRPIALLVRTVIFAGLAQAGMLTVDFVSHAQEWIAAWNAHDLERILAHYADDVELT